MSLFQRFEEKYRSQNTGVLQRIRDAGWQRFTELGLPKTELHWDTPFPTHQSTADIQFVDGKFVHASVPRPALCISLEEAMRLYKPLLHHHLIGSLRAEMDPFVALNTAIHERAAFLYLPPDSEMTLTLSSHSSLWTFPRIQIFLGFSSRLTLYNTATSSLGVIDCHLDKGSQLDLFDQTSERSLHHLRATLKRNSRINTFTYSEGGSFCHNSIRATLAEEGASARFSGLTALTGGQKNYCNVTVEHTAPHCTSHQHFKSLIGPNSLSQFNGNIFVRRIAQKTVAYQLSQNLLLSESAKAIAIPNLEILADDVKASHGATVSVFSPEDFFYLETRGISKKMARRLLVESFAQEMVDLYPGIQPRLARYFETL